MAVLANNRFGDSPLIPGQAFAFSLKNETSSSDVSAWVGASSIVHKIVGGVAVLPENAGLLADVAYESPERRRPLAGEIERAALGTAISLTGLHGAPGVCRGIYELTIPMESYSDIMGMVSLRVFPSTWVRNDSPYWADQNLGLAPLYFGLEHGVRNTGIFAFLGTGGSIFSGGPCRAYGEDGRQASLLQPGICPWDSLNDGDVVTLFAFMNERETKLAYAWHDLTKIFFCRTVPTGQLGHFQSPSSGFSQARGGPTTQARLFFGNTDPNAQFEVIDYGIFPFFPQAVAGGVGMPGHSFRSAPDSPRFFRSSDRVLPSDPKSGWVDAGDNTLDDEFWYQPGRPSTPLYTRLKKTARGTSMMEREEPFIGQSCYIEAWMAGSVSRLTSINTGIGLQICNGVKSFRVVAIDNGPLRTYGIVKRDTLSGSLEGYWLPSATGANYWDPNSTVEPLAIDYQALRLVRLVLARDGIDEVQLYVEDMDTPVLRVPISAEFPDSTKTAFSVGHVDSMDNSGEAKIGFVCYSANTRFEWWKNGPRPGTVATLIATAPDATARNTLGEEVMTKESYTITGTPLFFQHASSLPFESGMEVEFRAKMFSYTDEDGAANAVEQPVGVGVRLRTGVMPGGGQSEVFVGFFDCGLSGRKIGILTGDVTEDDIIFQTEKGRRYSAQVDWFQMRSYRFVYLPRAGLRVYLGNLKNPPAINIPWSDYVPKRLPAPATEAIAFGHIDPRFGGVSHWEYVRCRESKGFDFELAQLYQNGVPAEAFGGKALLLLDATIGTPPVATNIVVNDVAIATDSATSELNHLYPNDVFDVATVTDGTSSIKENVNRPNDVIAAYDSAGSEIEVEHSIADTATATDSATSEVETSNDVEDTASATDSATSEVE